MKETVFKSNFNYYIGYKIQDDKRDIIITDAKRDKDSRGHWWKYYKYKCNKCGFDCGKHYNVIKDEFKEESWVLESNIKKQGCACCCRNPQVVVEYINAIATTDKWMIKYFSNSEDTKKYTKSSTKKIQPVCPDCGRVKRKFVTINSIYMNKNIFCACSDKLPYGEKVIFNVLEQLELYFEYHKTFEWSKNINFNNTKLFGNKEYDFAFTQKGEQFIVETNGKQHYEDCFKRIINSRTLSEEQDNDRVKKQLALSNGVKEENYIVIDCRNSKLEFIKQNILSSRLYELFDLSKIDWLKCEEFALSNRVKEACDYKKNNPCVTTGEIGLKLKLSSATIRKYLKLGNGIWCYYDAKEESRKASQKSGRMAGKPIEMYKNNILVGIYNSAQELSDASDDLYNIHLNQSNIRDVCVGRLKSYKGYYFKEIKERN